MKGLVENAVVSFLGLTASNFIWQAFTRQEWRVAAEWSWFQLVAIAVLTGLLALKKHSTATK